MATTKDVEERVIFERERYAERVFSGEPMTPAMIGYGRRRSDQITPIFRRAANTERLQKAA